MSSATTRASSGRCDCAGTRAVNPPSPSVCPGRAVAQNKGALQQLGVTHVLNAAHSKRGSKGNQSFYGSSFVYCGIPADDSAHFDLDVYFQPAADFIHRALKSPNGAAHILVARGVRFPNGAVWGKKRKGKKNPPEEKNCTFMNISHLQIPF